MNNSKLQKALEEQLDGLLVKINEEWNEAISRNEELFFEHLTLLNQYDFKRANEYSEKYDKILIGRI